MGIKKVKELCIALDFYDIQSQEEPLVRRRSVIIALSVVSFLLYWSVTIGTTLFIYMYKELDYYFSAKDATNTDYYWVGISCKPLDNNLCYDSRYLDLVLPPGSVKTQLGDDNDKNIEVKVYWYHQLPNSFGSHTECVRFYKNFSSWPYDEYVYNHRWIYKEYNSKIYYYYDYNRIYYWNRIPLRLIWQGNEIEQPEVQPELLFQQEPVVNLVSENVCDQFDKDTTNCNLVNEKGYWCKDYFHSPRLLECLNHGQNVADLALLLASTLMGTIVYVCHLVVKKCYGSEMNLVSSLSHMIVPVEWFNVRQKLPLRVTEKAAINISFLSILAGFISLIGFFSYYLTLRHYTTNDSNGDIVDVPKYKFHNALSMAVGTSNSVMRSVVILGLMMQKLKALRYGDRTPTPTTITTNTTQERPTTLPGSLAGLFYMTAPRNLFMVKDNHEPILPYKWALLLSFLLILFSVGAFIASIKFNLTAVWNSWNIVSTLEVIGLAYGLFEIAHVTFLLIVMFYCNHPCEKSTRTHDPLANVVDELKFPITTETQSSADGAIELMMCSTTSTSFDFSDVSSSYTSRSIQPKETNKLLPTTVHDI